MEKDCLHCGSTFYKQSYHSQKTWGVRKYCSRKCTGLANLGVVRWYPPKGLFKGSKSPLWKGGKPFQDKDGYIRIWTENKRQLEHRYVMEQHLGRKLLPEEHVHHLNGIKTDNRLENLTVIDRKEHGIAHARQRWHGEKVDHLHGT